MVQSPGETTSLIGYDGARGLSCPGGRWAGHSPTRPSSPICMVPTCHYTEELLHVTRHIAVDDCPDDKRSIQPLQLAQYVALRHLDLDAKILLGVNRYRLSETERGLWVRIAVCRHPPILGIRPGPSGEEVCRHLNHDLLPDEEGGDGVVDKFADNGAETVMGEDLLVGGKDISSKIPLKPIGCPSQVCGVDLIKVVRRQGGIRCEVKILQLSLCESNWFPSGAFDTAFEHGKVG